MEKLVYLIQSPAGASHIIRMSTTSTNHHPTKSLLEKIEKTYAAHDTVTLGELLNSIGRRSFGPMILSIGAFLMIPGPSDIPTVPSILGSLIILIGIQIVFGREHIWLPGWLLKKSLQAKQLDQTVQRLKKPAQYMDKIVTPRLTILTTTVGSKLAATACILLALLTPFMELIPFSANVAGVALVFFGLGFVGRDGLMHLMGYTFCGLLLGIGTWFFAF